MTDEQKKFEKEFKEKYGLKAFFEQLTKQAAAYDEDRHWEVNEKRYEKKQQQETSEHDFMNKNRFLAGRMKSEPMRKEEEKVNRFLDKKANEDSKLQEGLGVAAIGGGGLVANKNWDKATGMETRYHGTGVEAAKGIKEKGLLASRAGSGVSTRRANLKESLGEDAVSGKVYLGRDKGTSKGYAMQAGLESVGVSDGHPQTLMDDDSIPLSEKQKMLNQARKNGSVLKAKIPYNQLNDGTFKTLENPELRGMSKKEFSDYLINESLGDKADQVPDFLKKVLGWQAGRAYKGLGEKTHVIEGDLPSQYFVGGNGYSRQNIRGVLDYAKANPGRFAGGAGAVGAGVGAAGLGAYGVYDGIRDGRDSEKNAFEKIRESMEKVAQYYSKK